jgi:acetyl esterase
MFAERKVPEDYARHMEFVETSQVTLAVPSVGVAVTCYITMPKKCKRECLVYINIHGGGWHGPWCEDDALYCAQIAHEVARWVTERCESWGVDSEHIAIGGCSSGGNMAAAVSLMAGVRKDIRFCAQILDCASLDKATDPQYKPCGYEYMMPPERGRGFTALYLGEELATSYLPIASPAYATDHMLRSQPRTLIISGGKCNFRFENEEYGARLAAQGVEVTIKRFRNSQHAFNIRMKDEWRESHDIVIRYLKSVCL